jgi:FkbM family methyltransferase
MAAPPFDPLVAAGIADVIGFEPIPEELAKLQAMARHGRRYLPYAIRDGTEQTFHINNQAMTSSLLPPNHELTDHFLGLSAFMQVVKTVRMQTRRLDDIPEIRSTDFLKLDVQGAELQVLNAGKTVLEQTLMVQTEVEFLPLYQGQPFFAEIDQCLRANGFLLHRMPPPPAGRSSRFRSSARAASPASPSCCGPT